MTDEKMGEEIHKAALILAGAMNLASETGLIINLEMRAHTSESQGSRLLKRGGYIPYISISRILYF